MNLISKRGFTLVEMLIVLGIVAILVAVVVSVLNPAEFFRQTRDSRRLSDLNQLDQAFHLAELDNVSMGTANVVYVSVPDDLSGTATSTCDPLGLPDIAPWTYQCSDSDNYRKVDGTGWVPVNFSSLVTVPSALSVLPVDPTNSTSTSLYYTYVSGSWELTALFESTKYQTNYKGFGTSTVYTSGNHPGISPNNIAMRTGTGGGGGTTQYTLTVSKTGDGSGTVTSNPAGIDCGSTCNYDFDDDTEVTLTAEATEGSTFTAWSDEECSGTGTCDVTLSEDREVTANFGVAGPAEFCVSGDENTTTTISGVMVYCDNSLRMWTPTADIGGSATAYTWGGRGTDEPTDSCIGIADRPACNYCENLTYAGYSDWVLPSCVSGTKGTGCQLYAFGMDACGWTDSGTQLSCTPTWDMNAQADVYWSSTEFANDSARNVKFSDGSVYGFHNYKDTSKYVRCIRGQ